MTLGFSKSLLKMRRRLTICLTNKVEQLRRSLLFRNLHKIKCLKTQLKMINRYKVLTKAKCLAGWTMRFYARNLLSPWRWSRIYMPITRCFVKIYKVFNRIKIRAKVKIINSNTKIEISGIELKFLRVLLGLKRMMFSRMLGEISCIPLLVDHLLQLKATYLLIWALLSPSWEHLKVILLFNKWPTSW